MIEKRHLCRYKLYFNQLHCVLCGCTYWSSKNKQQHEKKCTLLIINCKTFSPICASHSVYLSIRFSTYIYNEDEKKYFADGNWVSVETRDAEVNWSFQWRVEWKRVDEKVEKETEAGSGISFIKLYLKATALKEKRNVINHITSDNTQTHFPEMVCHLPLPFLLCANNLIACSLYWAKVVNATWVS